MQRARTIILNALDTAGGIAAAGLVFCGVLLAIMGIFDRRALTVAFAVLFVAVGSLLALTKRRRDIRTIVGAVFLALVAASFLAALLLPGLHYR